MDCYIAAYYDQNGARLGVYQFAPDRSFDYAMTMAPKKTLNSYKGAVSFQLFRTNPFEMNAFNNPVTEVISIKSTKTTG